MGRIGAIAVCALLLAVTGGCTSSASDPPPSTQVASSIPPTSSMVPTPTTSAPSTPTAPATPTVPADVPTTGPNTKPGERPPVMPIAATKHSAAGAQAFAKFFMETIDWGYATIDGAYIRHYAARGCSTCVSLAAGLDADRKAGKQYIGGRSIVTGVRTGAAGPLKTQIVKINSTSFEELTKGGKFVTADQAYTGQQFQFNLKWAGRWTVVKLAVIQ